MRKFKRQTSKGNGPVNAEIDFGAAATKVPHVIDPGEYKLRIDGARVIEHNSNILVALDLATVENNQRMATSPLWVDGPNSNAGQLVAENQHLVAQLLQLRNLPTSGNVSELIPKLAGLEFEGRVVLAIDNRSGRTFNAIADVFTDDAAS